MNKRIVIFGNAVQDIMVEVDLDRILRQHGEISEYISLDKNLHLKKGSRFTADFDSTEYSIEIVLKDAKEKKGKEKNGYVLEAGWKYTLKDGVAVRNINARKQKGLTFSANCTAILWGGGGLNMCKTLRYLVPSERKLGITYLDIAMSNSLQDLVEDLKKIKMPKEEPTRFEKQSAKIARLVAKHSPVDSLEVYLAAHSVDTVLFRSKKTAYRHNWVFRRVRSGLDELTNKIVCRGQSEKLSRSDVKQIKTLFNLKNEQIGAICLNSIKEEAVFKVAYNLYKQKYLEDDRTICTMAMTSSMQQFTDFLLKDAKNDPRNEYSWPPFILVFNETEIVDFVYRIRSSRKGKKKTKRKEIEFWSDKEMPDMRRFAELIDELWSHFKFDKVPRIYVTLGSLGCLGYDGQSNNIIFTSAYNGKEAIYDTNGCGDAFCATITLLEWAKRQDKYENIGQDFKKTPQCNSLENAQEMEYFMAVGNAVAYCKATSPTGRVDRNKLMDLLDHEHLASGYKGNIKDFLEGNVNHYPDWVDRETHRLKHSRTARQIRVSDTLGKLISGN